jgi:phospholipid/cholesterol/gamma-HCH transport system substrate-binding protein
MATSNAAETVIGAAVLAAAAGFMLYAGNLADIGPNTGADRYELTAAFRKAEGLSAGTDVRVAGVKVGSVRQLTLDPETFRAVATLSIESEVKLPEDSDAAILTEGLLGGSYVAITPGGSEFDLAPGDEIMFTQGSVNLMDLVGRAITGGGSE